MDYYGTPQEDEDEDEKRWNILMSRYLAWYIVITTQEFVLMSESLFFPPNLLNYPTLRQKLMGGYLKMETHIISNARNHTATLYACARARALCTSITHNDRVDPLSAINDEQWHLIQEFLLKRVGGK